jgi:outer membrane protein TolC
VQAFHSSLLFTTPASIAYTALSNLFTPVLNRQGLKARLLAANSRQVQAVYQYQQTLLRGFTEVQTELSNQQNLGKVRAYKQAQSQILTQSVSTSRDLYRTARASYVEVLFAQQHALKANLELVNAVKNLRISTVNLYRALGGGWK